MSGHHLSIGESLPPARGADLHPSREPGTFFRMTRADVLQRIEHLTDSEFDRVAPYIEADLDAANALPDLRDEIARGEESARTEPLLDHETVMAMGRARLRAP